MIRKSTTTCQTVHEAEKYEGGFMKRGAIALTGLIACTCTFSASAATISPGFDLFQTPTFTTNLGPYGLVQLESNPIGPGNTDTIVLRKQGIDPFPANGSGVVDIELIALSLKSSNQIDLDPGAGVVMGNLYVVLNRQIEDMTSGGNQNGVCDVGETCRWASNQLAHSQMTTPASTGQMEIFHNGDGSGGTFQVGTGTLQDFLVSAELYAFDPLNGLFLGYDTLNQNGDGQWSHTPLPNYPVDPGFPAGNFYVTNNEHTGPHGVIPSIPEPTTYILMGVGLGLIAWRRRKA